MGIKYLGHEATFSSPSSAVEHSVVCVDTTVMVYVMLVVLYRCTSTLE